MIEPYEQVFSKDLISYFWQKLIYLSKYITILSYEYCHADVWCLLMEIIISLLLIIIIFIDYFELLKLLIKLFIDPNWSSNCAVAVCKAAAAAINKKTTTIYPYCKICYSRYETSIWCCCCWQKNCWSYSMF